jgi:hypothetical protein
MLNFNRAGGSTLGPARTIEVVLKPLITSTIWGNGLLLQKTLSMSGGGYIDHFDSGQTTTSTFLISPSTYRSTQYNESLVGMLNANGSNIGSTYVYGQVSYSTTGSAPQNTSNIQGTPKLTTPFNGQAPTVQDPSWTGGSFTPYTGGNNPPFSTIAASGSSWDDATLVKITGDFNVPSGKSVTISKDNGGSGGGATRYIIFWITGKYNTSGSGFVSQDANVQSKWFIDNSITTSGGSYMNPGAAGNVSFIGVAPNSPNTTTNNPTFTVSGGGSFIGTIEAPAYAGTVSGAGSFTGAIIASTLTLSGGASFHYDDALGQASGGNNPLVGNFAFASWFEDNSAPNHKDSKQHYIVY